MKRMMNLAVFLLAAFMMTGGVAEESCAHQWSVIGTTMGNCVTAGTETRKCSLCGAESTIDLPLGDHNYAGASWIVESQPTCTAAGVSSITCIFCGNDKAYREIPATGHAWQSSSQAATCTQPGFSNRTCSQCGETQTESIPAKGHSEVTDPGRPADCTQGGITEGKHCTVCGAVTMAQQNIPPTGHRMTQTGGRAPTCTESGQEAGEQCADCGYSRGGAIIPAVGHQGKGDGNRKEPTCTEKGLTESRSCARCGDLLAGRKMIAAKGHKETTDAAQAPTAGECGFSAGAHCENCGLIIKEQRQIPAIKDFPGVPLLLEALHGEYTLEDTAAYFLGENLAIGFGPSDASIALTIAIREERAIHAFRISTCFEKLSSTGWKEIAPADLASDAHYGAFVQQAGALLRFVDPVWTEDAAEHWLTNLWTNSLQTDGPWDALFASFAAGDAMDKTALTEKNGYEYLAVSDDINLSLMIRRAAP